MTAKEILLGFLAFFFISAIPGRGHLKFDESFKDLGTVKQGEAHTYSFSFTNTGDKKLKILSVITVSSCLKVTPIKDSIIAPDAVGEIFLVFDTRLHARGDFAFGISVNSNADNKEVRLKMFGNLD